MARYIDADAFEVVGMKDVSDEFAAGVQFMLEQLDKAQTIEARPVVRGEWIDGFFKDTVECSVCFEKGVCKCYETRHNFCPNCGAENRGDGDGK